MNLTDPRKEYLARVTRWNETERQYDQRHRRVGDIRIAIAAILVASALFLGRTFLAVEMIFTGLIVGLFFSGMLHDRVLSRRDNARRARRFYKAGLDRLADKWAGKGSPGTEFLDPHHPYAIDLDLFGSGSVFELLNTAQTQGGRATLAQWLLQRASVDEIQGRQKAVTELREKLDLREQLALLAGDAKSHIQTDALIAWARGERVLTPTTSVRVVAFCFPVLTWSLLIVAGPAWFAVALAAQMAFGRLYQKRVKTVFEAMTTPAHDLNWLARLFQQLEREIFQTARLQQLQAGWNHEGVAASEWLRGLARLLDWLDSREHLLITLLGPFFLLQTQFAFALEARRARFGHKIETWVRDLGEMEALASLACYSFERPADPFPDVLPESSPVQIEAKGLAHPLISETRSVRNDVALDSEHRLLVISGSNMSGKSTWLRALGVNMVLAMAGGPVRAQGLRFTPLPVGASIRTMDSLNEGISRFYAEIKRLRQIIELTDQNGRLLFLIDELLNGTNSHDRRIGAASVVKTLVDRGAMGLVTTHDLALTHIVDEVKPPGANFHFEDQFVNGQMTFDYQLRPGIVEKSNALELMRSIGLKV